MQHQWHFCSCSFHLASLLRKELVRWGGGHCCLNSLWSIHYLPPNYMAGMVVVLWEHCITLISKGMCQDERVPLCLLSAVENGQEGGGRSGVFIKRWGREGTAGAPQLSLSKPPSSQASALVANTLSAFRHGDSSTVRNPVLQHRYEPERWGSMLLSCSRREWELILHSPPCPQPSLIRNGTTCLNGLGFSCHLATGLPRKSLSLETPSKHAVLQQSPS